MQASSRLLLQQLQTGVSDKKAYLLFGPNATLVKSLRRRLVKLLIPNQEQLPFRLSYLTASEVVKNPTALWDVSASACLYGGEPVVEITQGSAALAPLLGKWLTSPYSAGTLLVTAAALKANDPLRLLFNRANNALAVVCYDENKATLVQALRARLAKMAISLDGSAELALLTCLPNQVQNINFYLGKLVYFAAAKKYLTATDIYNCFSEAKPLVRLQQIADACAAGEVTQLVKLIQDKQNLKEPALGFVRWTARHFKQLRDLKLAAANRSQLASLLRSYRPPIHFSRHPQLTAHWQRWSLEQIDAAAALLLETEIIIKTTHPYGAETLTSSLIRLARIPEAASLPASLLDPA